MSPHARGHGTQCNRVFTLMGNMFPRGCIFGEGDVGLCVPRARAARYITRSPPCIFHVWGLGGCKDNSSFCMYGFGRGIEWPCSICGHRGWGPNWQGQGIAQPQLPPEVPNSCLEVPLSALCVCIEGGFASLPPLLRYFGAVCPALVSATVEGEEATSNRTGGVLWACRGTYHLGAGRSCGCWSWSRLRPVGWAVAVRAVLGTVHPPNCVQSGGGTAGAQHPGGGSVAGGTCTVQERGDRQGSKGRTPLHHLGGPVCCTKGRAALGNTWVRRGRAGCGHDGMGKERGGSRFAVPQ